MPEIEYSTSKALYHTDKIKLLQENKPITPTEIQLDLEAYCNDNCEFCSYRKEDGYNNMMLELIQAQPGKKYNQSFPIGKPSPTSRIPLEFAETFPRQMKEAGIPAIEITGGGEPTLWPAFDTLIENLGLNGIEIGIVTNGSTMTEKRAELIRKYATWVRISMDAATADVHKKVHRTPTDQFHGRIKAIHNLTREPKPKSLTVGISFIITPDNRHQILHAARLFKGMNVDHLRFSWMYDKEGHAGLTEKNIHAIKDTISSAQRIYNTDTYKIFTEYNRIDLYSRPNDDFNKCYYQRFVMAIGADCKVYPCCIQKYHRGYDYADIRENTLKEIINGNTMHGFMDNLDVTKCNPCWLRNRNKSIAAGVEQPKHHNFI